MFSKFHFSIIMYNHDPLNYPPEIRTVHKMTEHWKEFYLPEVYFFIESDASILANSVNC